MSASGTSQPAEQRPPWVVTGCFVVRNGKTEDVCLSRLSSAALNYLWGEADAIGFSDVPKPVLVEVGLTRRFAHRPRGAFENRVA
jgi:hypothetical protein